MKDTAVWIMGARHRQVMLICALALLPAAKVISVGIATASVLAHGVFGALPILLSSFSILAVAGLVSPEGGFLLAAVSAAGLSVAALLGWLLRRTGSLTFSVQLSLLGALAAVGLFFVAVGDVRAYWTQMLPKLLAPIMTAAPTPEQASLVSGTIEQAAGLATGMVISSLWLTAMGALMCGYYLWDVACDGSRARFGRFRGLNLGRALAALLLLLAVVSTLLRTEGLLANLAIVAFLAFGLHGLALVHWGRHRWRLPVLVLPLTYVLLPLGLWQIVCIVGYVDAWFNFSRRQATTG